MPLVDVTLIVVLVVFTQVGVLVKIRGGVPTGRPSADVRPVFVKVNRNINIPFYEKVTPFDLFPK